jgi:hypothetical protein
MEKRPGIDTALAQSFGDLVGPAAFTGVLTREGAASLSLALCLATTRSRLAFGAPRVFELIAYQEGP